MASGLVDLRINKEYLVYGFIRCNCWKFIATELVDLCCLFYSNNDEIGYVMAVCYPLIKANCTRGIFMYSLVLVGKQQLVGEVVKINESEVYIQMYYDIKLVSIGDIVITTKKTLSVELGPGLLGNIFDGMQRPLNDVTIDSHSFMSAFDRKKLWNYKVNPELSIGDKLAAGDIIGTVYENEYVPNHKILVPPKIAGEITFITKSGEYNIDQILIIIKHFKTGKDIPLKMTHFWPARFPRPYHNEKIASSASVQLLTGQRVLDCLFPMIMGSTCAIIGGHGTGKTVLLQSIAKCSNCDVIVFVSCGQRGNEVIQMAKEFDMEKTCLIVNTSNMPIANCEAVIYVGITVAEYYRDQGLNCALLIDGISQWADFLRRMDECKPKPAALCGNGYPSWLNARIAALYERAGYVGERKGSLSIIAGVSPRGDDFEDPVVMAVLNISQVFWGLRRLFAERKYFPAVSYMISFTKHYAQIKQLYDEIDVGYMKWRESLQQLLSLENDLQEIVSLVGKQYLSEEQKLAIDVCSMVREDFLQQDVYSVYDYFCPLEKTFGLLQSILMYYKKALFYVEASSVFENAEFKLKEWDNGDMYYSQNAFTVREMENHCKDLICQMASVKMEILPNAEKQEIVHYFERLREKIEASFATIDKLAIEFVSL